MSKSYRYDHDADDGDYKSRSDIKRLRKQEKRQRRQTTRQEERMDGGADTREAPFDVMSTIDPADWN